MTDLNDILPIAEPPHPGEFIEEDILAEHGLTQQELADRLGVSRRTINELVNRRRGVSADMALRLAKLTGRSAEQWLRLQMLHDLWTARQSGSAPIDSIQPLEGRAA